MEKRAGEDRRIGAVSHEDIMQAVKENSERIDRIENKVDDLSFPHDWEEVLRDVAAVGRTGRLMRRIVVWGTPIIGGIAAAWHYVTNGFNSPPGN